jgi:hypothetical protein
MGKNQSASNLTNIIKQDADGSIAFMHGNTMLMQVSSSGTIETTGNVAGTASYAANAELFDGLNSTIFATTGSNTFTSAQYISNTSTPTNFTDTASLYTDGGMQVKKDVYLSSSLFVKGDLTIFGTQSVNYITSSQLNIATNIITVNTSTPAVRFGGLAVYDSGSLANGLTGSLLWDSQNNHWVYTNPSGSSYSGGMLISGPRASSLGSEQGTTNNALMKGQGGDHITSSAVFEVSGSVGIGTSTPPTKLHVAGYGSSGTGFYSSQGIPSLGFANSSSVALFTNGDVSYGLLFGVQNTGNGWIQQQRVDGAGTSYNLLLQPNGGNVGIGTNSPDRQLIVSGSGQIGLYGASSGIIFNNGKQWDLSLSTNDIVINETGVAQRIKIQAGGNIGVGTSNPIAQLHVYNASAAASFLLQTNSSTDYAEIAARNYNQTSTSYYRQYSTSASGTDFGLSRGNLAALFSNYASNFAIGTQNGGALILGTANTERVRIDTSGNVGIGTASPGEKLSVVANLSAWSNTFLNTSSSSVKTFLSHGEGYGIAVDSATNNSSVYLIKLASGDGTNRGTTVQFQVFANGNTTVGGTLTENSSIRYKTNIETVKYGLDKILQLRGVTYDKKDTGVRELGLIAEEVNEILPDVVIKNEEGEPDSVSYGRITAVLIEAVKDLQSQINELKAK